MKKITKHSFFFLISVIFMVAVVLYVFLIYINKKNIDKFRNGEVKIFCWGQYISDGSDGSLNILNAFEEETKVKISAFNTFESSEQMYTKLKNNNSNYDVIFCCDYMIPKLIDEKLIQKIDTNLLSNYENIIPNFKGDAWGYDKTNSYSIPYSWGHVGIVYNKKLVEDLTNQKAEDVITGWDCLWDSRLKQNILMFVNSRDSFSIAQKLLKNSINTTRKTDILNAAKLLQKQKPLVQAYVMDEMFDKMENNEAAVCVAYSGDIINMMKNNSNLRYCFPKEGSNIFIDTVCIPANAKNKDNAMKFLDFLCRTDIAIANAKFLSYSSAIKPAYDLLKQNTEYNYISYPNDEILNRCEIDLSILKQSQNLIYFEWRICGLKLEVSYFYLPSFFKRLFKKIILYFYSNTTAVIRSFFNNYLCFNFVL